MRSFEHMVTLGFVILAPMILMVPPAFSQDEIGIYWDAEYTQRTAVCTSPITLIEGYLVIENPSVGGGISGWECELLIEGPAYFTSWSLAGQAFNIETPPRFTVGLTEPLPPGSTTAIATFQILVTAVEPVWIGLSPLSGVWPERPMFYRPGDQPEAEIPLDTVNSHVFIAWIDDLPLLQAEPDSLDFGHVVLGNLEVGIVTVTNVSNGMLWLDPELDCPNGDWELLNPAQKELSPGGTFQYSVGFQSEVLGESRCNLLFGQQLLSIALVATPGPPQYAWETSGPLDLEMEVGQARSGSVTLENTGDLPLELYVGLSGDTDHIEINNGDGARTLSPRVKHTVSISAFSWTAGEFLADLDFGPGLPSIPVTATVAYDGPIAYSVSEDTLDFGFVTPDSTSTLSFNVANTGSVQFAVIPVVDPPGTAFSLLEEGVAIPVPAGDRRGVRIYVDFSPTFEGPQEAVLLLGEGLPQIPLLGRGTYPGYLCGVQPDTFNFGTIEVDAWSQSDFQVRNEGGLTLVITPQSNSPKFFVDSRTRSLEPGDYANIPLRLASDRVGDFIGVIDLGPEACSDLVVIGSVTDTGVPTSLPSPAVLLDRHLVELTWNPHMTGVDGYHVWRREPEEQAVRLTTRALEPLYIMHFTDEPPSALGSTLHYSYSVIISGKEAGRSPETTVILPDVPVIRSQLLGAAPNPFNPETTIRFAVGQAGQVKVDVYDMTGRWLRTLVDRYADPGNLKVRWDGKDEAGRRLPSGPYIIRLETVDRIDSQKLTMLK